MSGAMAPRMIFVRGSFVDLVEKDAVKVVPFQKSGLEFVIGRDKCKARALDVIDLVTGHDTAGEGTGPRIYANLRARNVSVHFAIDREGVIWQFCDPAIVTCYHMGPGNSRSIGIEHANAVFPAGIKPGTFAWAKKLALTGREKFYGRPTVQDDYRGKKRRALGHFEPQKKAFSVLVRTLLREFPTIPARLPRVEGRVHGERVQSEYTGVAGHSHFVDSHVDPVLDIFDRLDEFLG